MKFMKFISELISKLVNQLFYTYFIFRGSLDCVQLINDEHMVSGADNG